MECGDRLESFGGQDTGLAVKCLVILLTVNFGRAGAGRTGMDQSHGTRKDRNDMLLRSWALGHVAKLQEQVHLTSGFFHSLRDRFRV
ncbi:MAG TPA: hypothetical protein DCZ69_10115, partial [Syntrophobacteraceae bacterium]|nr:hypothetical protein [Syntrophobacteraceae bacterium]